MSTITVNPSGYDDANSVYESLSNATNGYAAADSTSYASIYVKLGDNAETIFYWTFDLSTLPSDAVIDSVACSAKCHSAASTGLPTRTIQMATGTTVKGDSQTISTTSGTVYTFTPGTWTASELRAARIKIYVKRNTTSSSTARTIRFYGATLTVVYHEAPAPVATGTLYYKENGVWVPTGAAYKKASGSWAEASDKSTVFVTGTNYRKGVVS